MNLTINDWFSFLIHIHRQGSVVSNDSSFAGGEGPNVPINEYQAAWNVTNAIQGMFIVSLPFAVLRGGYWAIIAMVGIAYICCYTGKVRCFPYSTSKSLFCMSIWDNFSFCLL